MLLEKTSATTQDCPLEERSAKALKDLGEPVFTSQDGAFDNRPKDEI